MIEPLFKQMNLMEPLLHAVEQCGYHTPTPIQQETIPPVLEGRDVLGCAQTGTGKTAAFALPILQRLAQHAPKGKGRPIRALVLTPTRELALQIYENFTAYGKKLPLRSCVIFGGVGQQPQVDALRKGVEILVATPGRLNDLIGQGHISLAQLEIFVLDEADRMLDMGFIHDVKRVIAQLPQKRQTLFFSATMPEDVEKLALSILSDPVTVKVDPVSSTVDTIRQYLYKVDKANKRHLLADLLKKPNVESALVFTRTKHGADRVVRELGKAGITARAIHGDKSQTARQEALSQFKKGKIHVLIATDIAARGIDIAGLSHVFNYDLPNEPEAYVHRIGRTGRAGHEGIAISFCCIDEEKQLKDIEKLINKKLKLLESQWPMQVFTETVKQLRPARKEKQEVQQSKAQHKAGKETVRPEKKEAKKQENTAKGSKDTKTVSGKEKKHGKPEQNAAAAQPKKAATENKASAKREKHKPENKQRSEKPARPERPVALQPERPQVIRPEKTPVRNDRFGPGSAAAAAMRSTPLERPVAVGLTEKKEPAYESERKQTVATSVTYRQYMENQRSQRRGALATGDDRR